MFKNKNVPMLMGIILLVSLVAWTLASAHNGNVVKRVKITPYNLQDVGKVKSMVNVRHEFKDTLTANVKVSQIEELEEIAKIEEVVIYEVTKVKEEFVRTCSPNDQYPYGIQMVNGGSGGEGVSVAVLDTGIYKEHSDLNVKVCKNATLKGIRSGCEDDHSHGTHVSGTIAANGGPDGLGLYGVAPEAELWSVKVCDIRGYCYGDDIAAALNYVAHRRVNIVNMSFTGDSEEDLITEAIKYAESRGVLLVAAAGNSGSALGSIGYPAGHKEVVAVGAINSNEIVASFSSRGINDGDYIVEEREVEFGAPGVSNESANSRNGCYRYSSGTSMSSPHIAGLAAKLWQGDAWSTREYLQNLAKLHDLDAPGDDPATGFGLPVAPISTD